jgi:hypothetical protein
MVDCGVTPPFMSLSHPTKGDDSSTSYGNCNVIRDGSENMEEGEVGWIL